MHIRSANKWLCKCSGNASNILWLTMVDEIGSNLNRNKNKKKNRKTNHHQLYGKFFALPRRWMPTPPRFAPPHWKTMFEGKLFRGKYLMHGSKEQFTHFCVVSKRALCCQYVLFHINKHDIPVGWCNCKLWVSFSSFFLVEKRWRINKRHGIRQTMLKVRIR